MSEPQFAYTGPTPATGYVGYVNLTVQEAGVRFNVRSEGEDPPFATYTIPLAEAEKMLATALAAVRSALAPNP